MKKYAFLFILTLTASLVSCSTAEEGIIDETIIENVTKPEVLSITETQAQAAPSLCQTCISQNPDLLPQYLCDNGDGTFTIDDRTKAYPEGTNFDSLIRAMESGDRFSCEE